MIGAGIAQDQDVPLIVDDYAMEKNFGEYEDKPVKKLQESMGLVELIQTF